MSSLPVYRKSVIALSALLLTSVLSAQTRFNFFAGPQVTGASYAVHGEKQETDIKVGFQAGAGAKIEFDNHLYFSPSVYYSLKGYKVKLDKSAVIPDPAATDNNVTAHTIETAFLLQYDLGNQASHLFIKLGPSLDFQIAGREKFNKLDGTYTSRSIPYGFSKYGRYAASAVAHIGYEMSHAIFLYAYYQHGLTNLNNADDGPTIQYRVAGISVGKYFK